jgi:FkbH-like protein
MAGEVGEIDSFHLARMAQLINKSNQFHLTTTRYPESELQAMAGRPDHAVRYFKLRDRFGDNGLISVVILRQEQAALVIDTWVMSCRVLARSMEEFILNEMIAIARARQCDAILGIYKPTAKNKLVSGLYERLGFEKVADDNGATSWRLAVVPGCERTSYVRTMEMAE